MIWEAVLIAFAALIALFVFSAVVRVHTTYEWNADLLYVNGRFERILEPGKHRLIHPMSKIDIYPVRSSEQWWTSGLTDVSSDERLPFRASALVHFRVTDYRRWHVDDGYQRLQNATSAALVATLPRYKVEALLSERAQAAVEVAAQLAPLMEGCEVLGVTIDTLQLPPETRRLFVEVEKARLEGLASLERARGEQAALRALANAARLLKDNPELLNLRLLQTVGTSKGATVVLGQGALADPAAGAAS